MSFLPTSIEHYDGNSFFNVPLWTKCLHHCNQVFEVAVDTSDILITIAVGISQLVKEIANTLVSTFLLGEFGPDVDVLIPSISGPNSSI